MLNCLARGGVFAHHGGMRSLAALLSLVLFGSLTAQAAAPAHALERVLAAAAKTTDWTGASKQTDRLQALRKQALRYNAVSEIPSDRYQITALAGPVDLVRFFHLAKTTCGGIDRRVVLLQQWKRENGPAMLPGATRPPPPDAALFPDDLPSNALGALFGEEVRAHDLDPNFDLPAAIRKFFAALEPVEDTAVAKHSFKRLVQGLEEKPTPDALRLSQRWLTAEPLFLLPVLAPNRANSITNATAALRAAGLEVREHEGEPIIIDRADSPDPAVAAAPKAARSPATFPGTLVMRPPEDADAEADGKLGEDNFPKAVPVPEEYPKAVPVKETPAKKKRTYPKAVPVR
jgi:hypothetical protein